MSDDIHALFALTLQGDEEDEAAWKAIHQLRRLGTREIFEQAERWCMAAEPKQRGRGAAVLAQLGRSRDHHQTLFADESYPILVKLLQHEEVPRVLNATIIALGHLEDVRAVPLVVSFSRHPDADVRFAVAYALGCFPNEPFSVTTLIGLMSDPDSDVRDWATFGLGAQGTSDSPEIREALLLRLDDADEDTRAEALVSLSKRKDERVLPALLRELHRPELTMLGDESARLMLGLTEDSSEWTGSDYIVALCERFPGHG